MRDYLVFGANEDGTLVPLGTVTAPDHDSAKKRARGTGYKLFGTCPVGNWSFGKVTTREIVDVEEVELPFKGIPEQLTVDDVIEEIENGDDEPETVEEMKADAIAEARSVIHTPLVSPEDDDDGA